MRDRRLSASCLSIQAEGFAAREERQPRRKKTGKAVFSSDCHFISMKTKNNSRMALS